MNVIQAMKSAKRDRKAKDLYDLKNRGYTDAQYQAMAKLVPNNYIEQYLKAEDDFIMNKPTTGKLKAGPPPAPIPQQPSFRDNYNTHLKTLTAQYQSAQEPERTILHMQLENGLRAFIL